MNVYLASGNAHKLEEFSQLVHQHKLKVNLHGAGEAGGMPDVEESGDTLEENARIKAEALLDQVADEAWVLSDDSGLLVDALDGAPGVHSARYAGPGCDDKANNIKLLQQLKDLPLEKRTAHFGCVLCFLRKGSQAMTFTGTCEGYIMTAPAGRNGFGYDPLFRPRGYTKTFAELGSARKHALSHRARAFAEWAKYLKAPDTYS